MCRINIFSVVVLTLLATFASHSTFASANFDEETYEVYKGDVDNDGRQDIYLHYPQRFLIIAGDIVVPVPLPNEFESFVLLGLGNGLFDSPTPIDGVDPRNFTRLEAFLGNFVYGSEELLIRSNDSTENSVVLSNLRSGTPSIAFQMKELNGIDLSTSTNEVLAALDLNGDGWTDLRISNSGFYDDVLYNNGSGSFVRTDTSPKYTETDYSLPPNLPSEAELVGITQNSLKVDNSGAAVYEVPIAIPPGVNGLQPNISLNYHSLMGNGVAGQGWAISGLSEISRCRSTIAQDGLMDSVDFDENDRFCIDGKRLVLVNQRQYGQDGSEYRTEIDSYSRISVPSASTRTISSVEGSTIVYEPNSFLVEAKSGLMMEYGHSADSKIEAEGRSEARKWLLNRVMDRNGNFYTIQYDEDTSEGDYRVVKIQYGLHETRNPNSALATIEFNYGEEIRPDNQAKYLSGSKVTMNKLLRSIDTYSKTEVGLTKVKTYKLGYVSSGVSSISKLQYIQECDSNAECLPRLAFNWDEESISSVAPQMTTYSTRMSYEFGIGNIDATRVKYGDFNGDGRTDIFYMPAESSASTNRIYIAGENPGQFVEYITDYTSRVHTTYEFGGTPNNGISRIILADFDGNGLTDVYRVMAYNSTANDRIEYSFLNKFGQFYSQGFESNISTRVTGHWGTGGGDGARPRAAGETADLRRLKFGDFNGDGLTDVLKIEGFNGAFPVKVHLAKPNEPGVFEEVDGGISLHFVTLNVDNSWNNVLVDSIRFRTGDFNGDGLTDLYKINGWGNTPISDDIYLSNGDGTFSLQSSLSVSTKVRRYTQDIIRGEGLYDTPKSSIANFTRSYFDLSRIKFGDFNGDGSTDIFWFDQENLGDHKIYFSNGLDGFVETSVQSELLGILPAQIDDAALEINHFKFSDINGDGKTDIYKVNDAEDQLMLSNGDGSFTTQNTTIATSLRENQSDKMFDIARISFVDFNGDGIKDVYYNNGGEVDIAQDSIYLSSGLGGNRIREFVDSLGVSQTVNYLTGPQKYEFKIETPSYPLQKYTPRFHLVHSISSDNGDGDEFSRTYNYSGFKRSLDGRGSLGFSARSIDDSRNVNIRKYFDYRQDYPFIGLMSATNDVLGEDREQCVNYGLKRVCQTLKFFDKPINTITYEWARAETYPGIDQVYPSNVTTTNYLYDDTFNLIDTLVQTSEINAIDIYGNSTDKTINTSSTTSADTFTSTTLSPYTVDVQNWLLNNKDYEAITYSDSKAENPDITQKVSFSYEAGTGNTLSVVTQPDSLVPGEILTTKFGYDDFGNIDYEVRCAGNLSYEDCGLLNQDARYTDYTYSEDGLFLSNMSTHVTVRDTDAQGNDVQSTLIHQEEYEYDSRFGVLSKYIDVNRLETNYSYDSLGREIEVTYPDSKTITTRKWCDAQNHCPTVDDNKGFIKVSSHTTGQPKSTEYLDQFNRSYRQEVVGFDGRLIFVDTEFDALGRVEKVSEPYFEGDASYSARYVYDVLGRVQERKYFDSDGTIQTENTNYRGLTTDNLDALNRTTSQTLDALGRVVTSTDADGVSVEYKYDVLSNTRSTKVNNNSATEVTMTYDDLGRQKTLADPDIGLWEYEYNSFGEQTKQISKRSARDSNISDIVTSYEFDQLSRPITRIESGDVSKWYYDLAQGKGLGSLSKQEITTDGKTHSKVYAYDNLGRNVATTYRTNNNAYVGTLSQDYDEFGRLSTVNYPTDFSVSNKFNIHGYMDKVERNDTGQAVWTAMDVNARGQLEWADLGNGVADIKVNAPSNGALASAIVSSTSTNDYHSLTYTYDAVGNVDTRTDVTQGITEHFEYDTNNRLDLIRYTGGAGDYPTQDYEYDELGNIVLKHGVSGSYHYNSCNAGPHAVCRAGSKEYGYDVVGNLVKVTNASLGSVVDISYTSFNKPKQIGSTKFEYGADRYRVMQEFVDQTGSNGVTYYVGNGFEGGTVFEQTSIQGEVDSKHYIYASNYEPVAVYIEDNNDSKAIEYYHRDALSSVVAITDQNGSLLQTVSHDAFGLRRNANLTDSSDSSFLQRITGNEGYTGHEELPDLGLIHMNGRVYDPEIGRFLSADPNIPDPLNSQSYNRYSYVRNNPLNLIDPSGYFEITCTGEGTERTCRTSVVVIEASAPTFLEHANFQIQRFEQSFNNSPFIQNTITQSILPLLPTSDLANAFADPDAGFTDFLIGGVQVFPALGFAGKAGKGVDGGLDAVTTGGSIKNVNKVDGTQNCASCAIATDATLAGNPASALKSGLTSTKDVAAHFGGKFGSQTSLSRIDAQISKAGDGARGVVFAAREGKPGHFFNVVNQNGTVRFLDGQTGKAFTSEGQGFVSFQLLRTN